jgi:hypothetical protein
MPFLPRECVCAPPCPVVRRGTTALTRLFPWTIPYRGAMGRCSPWPVLLPGVTPGTIPDSTWQSMEHKDKMMIACRRRVRGRYHALFRVNWHFPLIFAALPDMLPQSEKLNRALPSSVTRSGRPAAGKSMRRSSLAACVSHGHAWVLAAPVEKHVTLRTRDSAALG